jgi:farnesyl-diphosphate farnesyltransferase
VAEAVELSIFSFGEKPMANAPNRSPTDLLREVSRSFYLTLRVLPGSIRPQIGLAYLLARTSDTIADTALVPLEQRLEALQAFRGRILDRADAKLDFGPLAQQQSSPAERMLLEQCETSLGLLGELAAADRRLVQQVIETITSGQELDLRRFAEAGRGRIVALRTADELEDYTYRVAGCVGEFWTRMCRAHVFPNARLEEEILLRQSVRFGKGLQLVNILRDLSADLKAGRCYLPEQKLAEAGLTPADLLEPANGLRLRPLLDAYLGQARDHLLVGWLYTNALPRRSVRVRLACAWPILIGLQTLQRLGRANLLEPQPPVKITRREVRTWMWRTVLLYLWPGAWQGLAEEAWGGELPAPTP